MCLFSLVVALVYGGATSGTASAQPRRTARLSPPQSWAGAHDSDHEAGRPVGGRSVGSPTDGHLVGGARLEESPWLRIVPCHRDEDVRWGLPSLISMIDHAARSVRKQFPDSVLSAGHVSRRDGGEVDMHASHESGRDADLGFYVVNQQGKSIFAEHFVPFVADGTAPSWPGAKFDDARNWALVASLVADPHARVSYLFVASPLRARLLTYAQRIGAPYAVRVRASEVMAQPRGSLPHDDHFHVRISCPSGMTGCIEFPTRSIARVRRFPSHPRAHVPHDVASGPAATPPLPNFPIPSTPSGAATGTQTPPVPSAGGSSPAPRQTPSRGRSPRSTDDLPAAPAAPASPPDVSPPPASLDEPIDDVDGIEE